MIINRARSPRCLHVHVLAVPFFFHFSHSPFGCFTRARNFNGYLIILLFFLRSVDISSKKKIDVHLLKLIVWRFPLVPRPVRFSRTACNTLTFYNRSTRLGWHLHIGNIANITEHVASRNDGRTSAVFLF